MKREIARLLISIGAVSLRPRDPFTWSSGLKSPIYCDNRLTLSYPKVRRKVAAGLAGLIHANFEPEQPPLNGARHVEVIAGTATAGIPHAAWVAEIMDLPMVYVRGRAKEHGRGRQIEGLVQPKQRAVIVEDLVSTGGSVLACADALRQEGVEVLGAVAIFTYSLIGTAERLKDANLPLYTLSDFWSLANEARSLGVLDEEEIGQLQRWHADPLGWTSQ